MMYFVEKNKKIDKYQVDINKKKLKKLHDEISINAIDPTYLQYLINELLNENVSIIDEIYGYKCDIEEIDKKLKKLSIKMRKTKDDKAFFESAMSEEELLRKRTQLKEEEFYIRKMKKYISFKLVDTISKKEINNVNKFLELENTVNYGKTKVKRIDKKRKK